MRTQQQAQQLQNPGAATLLVPAGLDITETGLVANGTLRLRDRAKARTSSNINIPLYNLGSVAAPGSTPTELGVQVETGNVTSVGSVFLSNAALVVGDLVTEGNATFQAGARVTKTTSVYTTIPEGVEVSWAPPVSANPANPRNVWANTTLSLAPGS